MQSFPTVAEMLRALRPVEPVYCIYPHVYRESTRAFLAGFPGRVLYAVKANNDPAILELLGNDGIRHFDCASVPEMQQVTDVVSGATCYFMNPVRLRGAARVAQQDYDVRHFVVDHMSALQPLLGEIDPHRAVIFARMAVHHDSAQEKLSRKFGATPDEVVELLQAIADCGAEPALSFNVGSSVLSPDAYVHGVEIAQQTLIRLPFRVRLVDIGGGFAKPYPGFDAPPLADYFAAIGKAKADLPLADNGEIMAEPGRALSAPGLSAVTEVLLRKKNRIYINDGMYGALWELRCNGQRRYAARCFGSTGPLSPEVRPYRIFGPTCDSGDMLPGLVDLPVDIAAGDYIEFGSIGAYSLSGRTDFNGFYSDTVLGIDSAAERPPA